MRLTEIARPPTQPSPASNVTGVVLEFPPWTIRHCDEAPGRLRGGSGPAPDLQRARAVETDGLAYQPMNSASLKSYVPDPLRRRVKRMRDPDLRELDRLRALPRYVPGQSSLLGGLAYVDGPSTVSQYRSIFVRPSFHLDLPEGARILDCGANIGLATLYWARTFQAPKITAFEADPMIAATLTKNVETHDVEVVAAAVWTSADGVTFTADGGDAGRVASSGTPVPSVRLRDWLADPVDLLKLDIEGAEVDVLADCEELLPNVAHVFVEYHGFSGEPQRLHYLLAMLKGAGFRTYVESEHPRSESPFVLRHESYMMDQQIDVWAYRA